MEQHEHTEQAVSPMSESSTTPIVLYTAEDNSIQLDVKLENETVRLIRLRWRCCSGQIVRRFLDILEISTKVKNWMRLQLVQKLRRFDLKANDNKRIADNTLSLSR